MMIVIVLIILLLAIILICVLCLASMFAAFVAQYRNVLIIQLIANSSVGIGTLIISVSVIIFGKWHVSCVFSPCRFFHETTFSQCQCWKFTSRRSLWRCIVR